MNTNYLKIAAGFVAGTAAGLAIGYLTAPASGRSTRKKITDKGNELASELKEKSDKNLELAKSKYNDSVEKMTSTGKEKLDSLKRNVMVN